jgi:hypothetical protein
VASGRAPRYFITERTAGASATRRDRPLWTVLGMSGPHNGKSPGMDVDRLRAETPGTEHRNHLNNAGAALMSRRTLAAMTEQLQLEAEIGGYEALDRAADRVEAT